MKRSRSLVVLAASAALAATACSSGAPRGAPSAPAAVGAAVYDPKSLPPGELGQSIALGHAIMIRTRRLMKGYVGADLVCDDCHIAAGTQLKGGAFSARTRAFRNGTSAHIA